MYVVICYDIEKDRKRKKIYDKLLSFGLRPVQKSVFEGQIKKEQLTRLKKQLGQMVNKKTDSIRYYTICETCKRKIYVQGMDLTPVYKTAIID